MIDPKDWDAAADPAGSESGSGRPVADAPLEAVTEALNGLRAEIEDLRAKLAVERRASEEQAHRNRNLLAVVTALFRSALEEAADLADARARLTEIPARLARGYESATRADAAGGDLRGLVETATAAFDIGAPRRVTLAGPAVALAAAAHRILALTLFELGANAVKHGALGSARGAVDVSWSLDARGLSLIWRETGAQEGMAPPVAGAGAGAALLRSIDDELGGTCASGPANGGYLVELFLPAAHAWSGATHGWPRRALVVEDNALIAADLADMLRNQGVPEVTQATSVAGARDILAAQEIDLVLLDVALGAEQSDALLGEVGGVPVIVVSGRTARELPAAFAELPLVTKPFSPADLAAALAELRGRRA